MRFLARWWPIIAVALAGAAIAVASLGLVTRTTGEAGPGVVEVRAQAALPGRSDVLLPPLGRLSARTHAAPVRLVASVEQVDIEKLQTALRRDDPGDALRKDVTGAMRRLLRNMALRGLLFTTVLGAIAGAVAPRRRWHHPVAGAAGALIATITLLGATLAGFDQSAFDQPTFEGPLERAPSILRAARRHVEDFDDVRRRIDTLGDTVADLYTTSLPSEEVDEAGEVRILHVSDIHSNPLGVELTASFAQRFKVQAVLDTGDLTSFGLPVESRIGDLLRSLTVPYLFVPGNHDSAANRSALPNVQVLDGTVADVGGIRILGVADPTFTATNETSTVEAEATKLAKAPAVAALTAEQAPYVLAVHDATLARQADVPLVVAGHVHKRTSAVRDITRILTVGSTGATGLETLTVRTQAPYEAQVLVFREGRLFAVDYVTLRGLQGSVTIDRRIYEPILEAPA